MAGTYQLLSWCNSWNRITHPLRVKSGMNMSAMIVLLMKWEYSQSESQKWQTQAESQSGGTCQL